MKRLTLKEALELDTADIIAMPALTKADARLKKELLTAKAKTLQGVVNKRIERLSQQPIKSPSLEEIEKSGGKIKLQRGSDWNTTVKEIARAEKFLSRKTSSVTGWKKTQIKTLERITGEKIPGKTDAKRLAEIRERSWNPSGKASAKTVEKREKQFWKAYRELLETDRGLIQRGTGAFGSDTIQQMLYNVQQEKYKSGGIEAAKNEIRQFIEEANAALPNDDAIISVAPNSDSNKWHEDFN